MCVQETNTPGMVVVYTESRTKGLSLRSVKDFTPYWYIIRPWSGLIRRLWLRGIKRIAEQETTKSGKTQRLERVTK
jgi:hypothetical protein